jgi:GNAT superfamily N-acetyltransferase
VKSAFRLDEKARTAGATVSEYEISTDPARLDVALIHDWLSTSSYWAKGIPRDVVERSIAHSLNFAVHHRTEGQVGYARVITDRATFAYLADVFVLDAHRGKGLSKRLMETILAHAELQGLRRWLLATRDAHELYERFGFSLPKVSGRLMERLDPDVYASSKADSRPLHTPFGSSK